MASGREGGKRERDHTSNSQEVSAGSEVTSRPHDYKVNYYQRLKMPDQQHTEVLVSMKRKKPGHVLPELRHTAETAFPFKLFARKAKKLLNKIPGSRLT